MNIISVLIFSEISEFDKIDYLPIDIEKKYPKNGTGLCNQIFNFINTICNINPILNNIYYTPFCKDINTGELIRLSEIINFSKIKDELGYNIYDSCDFKFDKEFNFHNNNYFMSSYQNQRAMFEYLIDKIIWTDNYENISKKIIRQRGLDDKLVNLVHLRIDEDCRNHVIGDREDSSINYDTEYWNNREKAYYELISRYEKCIYENCSKDIPLVILMEEVTHPFVQKLKEDYDVIFFNKDEVSQYGIDGRELFALIDLLIGKNLVVENYIGMENTEPTVDGIIHASSFSIVLKYLTNSKNKHMI